MNVRELKQGDFFRYGNKRKPRQFINCHELNGPNVPPEHAGKLLVIYNNCRQMICNKDMEVEVING